MADGAVGIEYLLASEGCVGEVGPRGWRGVGWPGGGGVGGGFCLASTANDGDQYEGQYDAECYEPTYSCAFVRHIRGPFAATALGELNGEVRQQICFPENTSCSVQFKLITRHPYRN